MIKKILYIIMLILMVSVVFGVTGQVTSFTGQSNPILINSNQTLNISFPMYSYVLNFTLMLNSSINNDNINLSNLLSDTDSNSNLTAFSTSSDNVNDVFVNNSIIYTIHSNSRVLGFYTKNFSYTGFNISINGTRSIYIYNDSFYTNNATHIFRSHINGSLILTSDDLGNIADMESNGTHILVLNANLCSGIDYYYPNLTRGGVYIGTCIQHYIWGIYRYNDTNTAQIYGRNSGGGEYIYLYNLTSKSQISYITLTKSHTEIGGFGGLDKTAILYRRTGMNNSVVLHYYGGFENITVDLFGDNISDYSKSPYIYNYNLTKLSFNITKINNNIFTCICSNCVVSGTNCNFPLNIIMNNLSQLQVNLTNASYAYGVDNCSNSFNIPSNATALNVSFYNYLNASTNVAYQSTTTYNNNTFSLSNNPLSKTPFCIYPNWLNLDTTTQFVYTDAYAVQYSYFLEVNLSNITQYLSLYTNNGTTQVLFTVSDLDGNPLNGYRIQILQFDVGKGVYTTTEILQTDSNGHAIGNIILNNAYYNFLVYDSDNILVKTLTGIRLTTTTYSITVTGTQDAYYTDLQNSLGVNTNVYFNNDTNNFVFTWSDPTGGMHLACLRVTNTTYLGITTMSDSCTESAAGTIIYNIAPNNDTQYIGTAYLKYDYEFPVGVVGFHMPDLTKLFNVDLNGGLFIGTLLILLGVLIALPNAVMGIIYFSIALIANVILGLFKFVDTSTAVGIGIMSSVILLGLVIIYIGGKQQ